MYPESRGMNDALSEGSTDGKYKKIVNNRDGVIDPGTYEERADLSDQWYGIHEKQVKVTPDGLLHSTPRYVGNPLVPGTDTY